MKAYQSIFNACVGRRHKKRVLKRWVLLINELERFNEIQCIGSIEGAMSELLKPLQVFRTMMKNKCVWVIIHPIQKLSAFSEDRNTLPPCEDRREKTGDLNILLFCKRVGNTYRVKRNKGGCVELSRFLLQKSFQVLDLPDF